MSDELVKRARHNALCDMPHYASVELIEALADCIERLQAELKEQSMQYLLDTGQLGERIGELTEVLEATKDKLAKAEGLLIDAIVQLEEGKIKTRRNRAVLIRQFLAELTGGKHD